MGKVAFIFPGQGSQAVGMGKAVYEDHEDARDIFQEANKRLERDLTSIIFEGPQEELTKTINTQPALLTTSIALYQLIKHAGVVPDYMAGHSLGEYSALVASGAIGFSDAVFAVSKRGEYMEEAVPYGQGTMAAVLGLDRDLLHKICESISSDGASVQLANLNCPGQIVISGTVQGVERAGVEAKEAGAKRVLPLQVSGPFHSSLMEPAAEKFSEILSEISIKDCQVPVIANVNASPVHDKQQIQELLVKQLYSPVLWEDTIEKLIELEVDTFVEIGPGKVLSGLVRKINKGVQTYSIQDPESCQSVIKLLKGEEE